MTSTPRSKPLHWQSGDERLRLLVESVKDYGIFTLDREGYVTSWNEGARRISGYEADEIIGQHFSRFYPPEDHTAKKPERELEVALAHGRVEDEGWRVRKDGTRFWADVIITPLIDPETGELRGFGKVTRDLTERKAAEEQLRQSEEQFRLLVEEVEEYAIFMLDPTGRVTSWNSGAQKAKGYKFEEIVGQHFERFYTPKDRAAGLLAMLLKLAVERGYVRDQGLRVRKDGSEFQADVLITAVHDATGTLRGFSKVTRDITEQIRNREMEEAKIAAEKANKAKDDFLAVLSHELRTPLTPVIAGAAYLAEHFSGMKREELLEEIGAIHRNATLEAQLIDDLLDLTRISRGKIELRFEAVNLHAAAAETLGILKENIASKELEISMQLAAPEHWVWADPTRIRQVFWNLLNNAVKFTPRGGKISLRSYNSGDDAGQLVVEVSDTGVGIEPDQTARIFIAFEQGERTVTRRFGGLGLGLAITRSLVRMHGGTISAHSEGKDKGTRFEVTLATVPQQASAPPGEARAAKAEGKAMRILLVDDHEDTRRILSRLLRKKGHEVEQAGTVAGALEWLGNARFDILISDIGLPDGSGHNLVGRAKAAQGHLRGIALSGFGMEEDIRRSSDAGFDFHLTKPVDVQVLQQVLEGLGGGPAPDK